MIPAVLAATMFLAAPGKMQAPEPRAGDAAKGSMGGMRALMDWMNGVELPVSRSEPRPPVDNELRTLGGRVYGERCAVCHGDRGDGQGREAARLSPRPRDLTAGVYRLRSTPSGSLPTDEDLFATISRGLHGTAMLPWVSLSERERWALVARVEAFSPRFAKEQRAAPVHVPPPPRETPALVAKGRAAYERSQCASCHGPSGRGDGPSAPTLRDDTGATIPPADFTRGTFRRGTRLEDVYLTLRTGLDGTPMPSYADTLSPEDTWALAAYVRSLVADRPQGGGMMCPMMGGGGDPQERLGMMIDMPGMPSGMGGMRMGR